MTKNYQKWRKNHRSGVILPQWNGKAFSPETLLGLPDSKDARLCKSGRKIKAAADGTYFVKRYSHRNLWSSLLHIFLPSRPLLGLAGTERAHALGIAAPEVIAAVREKKYRFLPVRDWLITEDLGQDLLFANRHPLTRALARNLTNLLATLHEGGMVHGDAQPRNLYFAKTSQRWGVIDLDGCRLYSHGVPRWIRRKELARLASAFLRISEYRNIPLDWDVPLEIAKFYCEACGCDLDDAAYRRRVQYLFKRIRKDQ